MNPGVQRAVALLALLTAAAVACANETTPASILSTLNIELDWVPNPDHVGVYYAQDKGYVSDVGLTLHLRTPSSAADPIKLVGLNEVDLAISYEPEMFYGQQEKLPVVAVATVVPVPLNSLIVSPTSDITTLAGLAGKKIGVTGIPTDDAFYQTMLKTAGLAPDDVTKVDVGFNLVPSVLSNKVDGILGGFRNVEAIQIAQTSGKEPVVFPADQLGVPSYAELVLVANADRLKRDSAYADAVKRFVGALVRGTDAAIADPAAATQILEKDTQYEPKFLDQSVPYTLTLIAPAAGTKIGCIDIAAWQSFGDWMKRSGLITAAPDASAISTDKYLPYRC
ncbi:MAG: ABC transporter substrate-binding protein [Actinomycetota bacterium]